MVHFIPCAVYFILGIFFIQILQFHTIGNEFHTDYAERVHVVLSREGGPPASELRVMGIYGYTPARHVVAGPGTC